VVCPRLPINDKSHVEDQMNRILLVFGMFTAMAVTVFAFYALYIIITALVPRIPEINPSVGAAIVAGLAAVSVGLATKFYEQKMTIQKELREKKVPVYEQVLNFLFRVIMSGKPGKEFAEDEMVAEFGEITKKLIIWGSDDVTGVYQQFREACLSTPANTTLMIKLTGGIMLAIRKDLGHANKGITEKKILSLFINDVGSLLK